MKKMNQVGYRQRSAEFIFVTDYWDCMDFTKKNPAENARGKARMQQGVSS